MTEVIEYKGKKFHVEEDDVDGGVISAFLYPVPDLPDEPPVGTILVDDHDNPWQRTAWGWQTYDMELSWEELLRLSDLRQVVVVGKATDSVVRFNGAFSREGLNNFDESLYPEEGGSHFACGYTDDEAPVHGYYKKVVD